MQNWITNFMEQYAYMGIALIIALENVFPPIPSSGFSTEKMEASSPTNCG